MGSGLRVWGYGFRVEGSFDLFLSPNLVVALGAS